MSTGRRRRYVNVNIDVWEYKASAGQQERGGEQEHAGDRDRRERAGEGREHAPDHHQRRLDEPTDGTPRTEDASGVAQRNATQPLGRGDRVEDAHAGDEQPLDDDHDEQPGDTRLDEGETEGEDRTQPPRDD